MCDPKTGADPDLRKLMWEEVGLTAKEKRQLKQPVTKVRPDNIFSQNLSQHTLFEPETDPKLRRKGIYYKRTGVSEGHRLTEAQISEQEERLGFRLPAPWREVYKSFNGGWNDAMYWGNLLDPGLNDVQPLPHSNFEFLALENVAPLRERFPQLFDGAEWGQLDPGLITLACGDCQAVILDYRKGPEPKVCLAFFNEYAEDPFRAWEDDDLTTWWPDMQTFFDGLYIQDRVI